MERMHVPLYQSLAIRTTADQGRCNFLPTCQPRTGTVRHCTVPQHIYTKVVTSHECGLTQGRSGDTQQRAEAPADTHQGLEVGARTQPERTKRYTLKIED